MKIIPLIAVMTLGATSAGWAGEHESFLDQYFQRSDTITLSAGNAKEVNAAIHVIDPWPRHSGNRRIPANGARMTGAIQRYRTNASPSGGPEGQAGQPSSLSGSSSMSGAASQTNAPR